jgi:hypothetical protein
MATQPTTKGADARDAVLSDATFVVARGDSLQALQSLCHADDVLSARYRLRSGPVFGSLLRAFMEDLRALADGSTDVHGDLLPAPGPDSPWERFGRIKDPGSEDWWRVLLAMMGDAPARLVLFCEIEDDPGDLADWHRASEALISLPRNITFVFSKAPDGWDLGPTVDAPGAAGAAPAGDVVTFVEAALSGDQPADVDRLGAAPLAHALATLLMLRQTRPLTVGVQAPWGWGKSSFVGFVYAALIRNAPANRDSALLRELETIEEVLAGPERSDAPDEVIATEREAQAKQRDKLLRGLERNAQTHVIGVSFNAWRYEGSEQVWAGLAREITEVLEGTLSRTGRMRSRLAYALWKHKLGFWIGFVTPVALGAVAALAAILLGLTGTADELSGWEGWPAALVPVVAVALIAWRSFRVLQPVSAQVAGYVRGPDYASHVGYQNEVIDDLKFLRGRVEGKPRIVVFVDDLDRCSDESIMETLQAINLVLGQSDFFVVLAIDPTMVHRAIARQRGIADDGDAAARAFAQQYLRKIIQLPLHLPGRTAEQRFGFVAQLFSPEAQRAFADSHERRNGGAAGRTGDRDAEDLFRFDLAAVMPPRMQTAHAVPDTEQELQALQDFQQFLDDNPRELKRLVNVHRFVKILTQRPDLPPTVERQRRLVAWLVYCARWPDRVDDALRRAADAPEDPAITTLGAYRFSGRDLQPGGPLEHAARISLLISDEEDAVTTRPRTAAASDPAARRAASPS